MCVQRNREGDTKIACVLHAHLLLLFKNLGKDDVNKTVASVVISAQVTSGASCCVTLMLAVVQLALTAHQLYASQRTPHLLISSPASDCSWLVLSCLGYIPSFWLTGTCRRPLGTQVWLMVHHRFDLEAREGAPGARRKSGGGTEGGLDRMSRALMIPPTEVFEILTQHRCVYSCGRCWERVSVP